VRPWHVRALVLGFVLAVALLAMVASGCGSPESRRSQAERIVEWQAEQLNRCYRCVPVSAREAHSACVNAMGPLPLDDDEAQP